MKRESVQRLRARYDHAVKQRELMRSLYDAAFTMSAPDRNMFTQVAPGTRKTTQLYDSTGVIATQRFVNHMQAALTPPFKKWVELKAGPLLKERETEFNAILEQATETAFQIINSSNFNLTVAEFFQELAIGTAVMMVVKGDGDNPISFITVPVSQIGLEENPFNGQIRAVFRKHDLPGVMIKETWPDAKIPEQMQQDIENNPMNEYCLIDCTYIHEGSYKYDVFIHGQDTRIVEHSLSYNPWVVTRWSKIPGEVFGRGPVIHCLDDLRMLNKVKELGLKSAQLNVFGVWTIADSDVINPNTLVINPGSFIPVSRNAGPNGPSIAPLPRSGDFNMQQYMAAELQEHIKQIMLNDRMPAESGPVRSATEIAARIKSNRIDTESAFGRLMYEFVQPLWQCIITILSESGHISLPEELTKIDNYTTKIDVLAPIAREQSVEEIQSTVNAIQIVQGVGGQELVAQTFKLPELGEFVAKNLGVSASILMSEEDKQEQRRQVEMMAMQMANTQQQAPQVGVM